MASGTTIVCMTPMNVCNTWRPSIMANGTIAFDTLSTSGQITGTAKSVDTDYVVNGSAKAWLNYTVVMQY